MTEQELNEIEKRATKATPGAWVADRVKSVGEGETVHACVHLLDLEKYPPFFFEADTRLEEFSNAKLHQLYRDAEFIAHARSDVPALVEEVRRLRNMYHDEMCSCSDSGCVHRNR